MLSPLSSYNPASLTILYRSQVIQKSLSDSCFGIEYDFFADKGKRNLPGIPQGL